MSRPPSPLEAEKRKGEEEKKTSSPLSRRPQAKKLRVYFRRPRGGERAHPRPLDSRDKGCLIQGPTHTHTSLDPYTRAHECTRSSERMLPAAWPANMVPHENTGTAQSSSVRISYLTFFHFSRYVETFHVPRVVWFFESSQHVDAHMSWRS